MKKIKLLTAAMLLLSTASYASPSQQEIIDLYIESKLDSFHHAERAKSVRNTLYRIQTENWWDDGSTFSSISDELNRVVSCYYIVTNGNEDAMELIDEIEFLVANDDESKKLYQHFIQRDSALTPNQISERDCY